MKKRPEVENSSFVTRAQSAATWRTNGVLLKRRLLQMFGKNDPSAADEVICERMNIDSTSKFKIMEWRVQNLK